MQKNIILQVLRQNRHKRDCVARSCWGEYIIAFLPLKYMVVALCAVFHYLNRDNIKPAQVKPFIKCLQCSHI